MNQLFKLFSIGLILNICPQLLFSQTPSFTWVGGSQTVYTPAEYGIKNVASSSNAPGAREMFVSWYDTTGNLWLFGGNGIDKNGRLGSLNDLWKYEISTEIWTWVSGSDTISQSGVYGTLGLVSNSSVPGARTGSVSWSDSFGNFWLFGGIGYDKNGGVGRLNDLWKYDLVTNTWTWMRGGDVIEQLGKYGIIRESSLNNIPGARSGSVSWTDDSGNLWLFGGDGRTQTLDIGFLNDLWKYDVNTNIWTWMSGGETSSQPGVYGTKGITSAVNVPGTRIFSSSFIDSSGMLWLFGGFGLDKDGSYGNLDDLWKYDPNANTWTWIYGNDIVNQLGEYGALGEFSFTSFPGARFNSRSWSDASGNLWLLGGHGYDKNGSSGYLNDLWKFNITDGSWTWVSGSDVVDQIGVYGAKGVNSSYNKPGARSGSVSWSDASGNLWLLGGNGYDKNGSSGYLNDLWKFNITAGAWTWVNGSDVVNYSLQNSYGVKGVSSSSNYPGSSESPVIWNDELGNLWLFGSDGSNVLWKYNIESNVWTWMSGSNINRQSSVYGVKGISSDLNMPGVRSRSVSWTDLDGNLWLFGGYGRDKNGASGTLNDLWKYSIASNTWTWMSGSDIVFQSGVYGSKGIAGTANIPGARNGSVSWTDDFGNLWLFGGYGRDQNGRSSNLNDLWKYEIGSNNWTWMSGSNNGNQSGIYGIQGITSIDNTPGAREGSVAWMDSIGNLWLFGGRGYDQNNNGGYLNDLWKYSPVLGTWTWIGGSNIVNQSSFYGLKGIANEANIPGGRSVSASFVDKLGNLWLFGGSGLDKDNINSKLNDLWKYDIAASNWTWMSGSNNGNQSGIYGIQSITSIYNTPGSREMSISFSDANGNIWLFGGRGYDRVGNFHGLNDLWKITFGVTQEITFSELAPKTYGDSKFYFSGTSSSGLPLTYNSSNINVASVSGNLVTIVGAGTTTITATQAGNDVYAAATPVSQTLTINKASLTAKADNKSRAYGEPNPTFTIGYKGFKNKENFSVLDITPIATTTATITSLIGNYPIIVSGGQDNNYDFIYVNGVLSIKKSKTATNRLMSDEEETGDKSISTNTTSFTVYPNPVMNELHIQIPVEQDQETSELLIFDQVGRVVGTAKVTGSEGVIFVGDYSPGSYVMKLNNRHYVGYKRFIKQ